MRWLDRIRGWWRKFKGDSHMADVRSQIAATNAEIAFALALQHMQASRGQFDIRYKSDPPPAQTPTSISGLNARLTIDDALMKEAINGLDSPQATTEDQRSENGSGGAPESD